MTHWKMTKDEIKRTIGVLYHRLSGRESPTGDEQRIISNAINEALIQFTTDFSVSHWRYLIEEIQVTTVPEQGYIDLPEYVIREVANSLKIPTRSARLYPRTLQDLEALDPGWISRGVPLFYAYDNSGNPDMLRLKLHPTPSEALVITMSVEVFIEQDDVAAIPGWMHGALLDLSTAVSIRRLGLGSPLLYEHAYEQSLNRFKNLQDPPVPKHISKRQDMNFGDDIHGRVPD